MIRWLVMLFIRPLIEELTPVIESAVRAAVDEFVHDVADEIEAVPQKVIDGALQAAPAVVGPLLGQVQESIFAAIKSVTNPFGGLFK